MLVCVYSNPINHRQNYSSSFPSIAVPLSETWVFLIEYGIGACRTTLTACTYGCRILLMVTGQVTVYVCRQDFSYGHCAGLEYTVQFCRQDFSYGHCAGLEYTVQFWRQDFSYGHCAGVEYTVQFCRQDFSYGHCAGLEYTVQFWRQDFSYGHCAGLEYTVQFWRWDFSYGHCSWSGGRTFLLASVQVWRQDIPD